MTSELKLCAACNSKACMATYPNDGGPIYQVICTGCKIRTGEYYDKSKAIDQWNTRAVPDVPELVSVCTEAFIAGTWMKISSATEWKHHSNVRELVLYSQAAAMLAAKDEEIERLKDENRSIFDTYLDRHNKIVTLEERAEAAEAELAQIRAQGPVATLHITSTDTYPDIEVEVHNGEALQPSMSPVKVYAAPVAGEAEIERLRKIAIEAQAGLCASTFQGARAFLEDILALSGKEPS